MGGEPSAPACFIRKEKSNMTETSYNLHDGMPQVPSKDAMLAIRNTEIYNYYFNRLVNLALSQFEWHNLPPGVDAYYLEKTLLFNGRAAIYNPEGTDIWLGTGYVFRNTKYGVFDVYGYPRDIYGIPDGSYAVMPQIPVTPGKFKVIYDNRSPEHMSLVPMMQLYAKLMWEIHDSFRAQVEHQLNPWIVLAPQTMKLTVQNFFNRLLGHQRVIQLTKGLRPEDIKAVDERSEFYGPEMLDCLKRTWQEALSMLGITSEISKKERMLDNELTMIRMEDNISLNSRMLNRVECCNYMNERFGFNMSVNLSSESLEFKAFGEEEDDGILHDTADRDNEPQDGPSGEPEET